MTYPPAGSQQIKNRIEKLERWIRMLYAGGIEAVISELKEEIRQLQELLSPGPD